MEDQQAPYNTIKEGTFLHGLREATTAFLDLKRSIIEAHRTTEFYQNLECEIA